MAYSDFTTLTKVRESFGLTIEESINLFTDTPEILPSSYLQTTLNENVFLATAINTEKARSELIIAPVLLEVRRILNFKIGFFSGSEFNVDVQAGLSGYCDYILTASKESYEIRSPVVTLAEAKNNKDFPGVALLPHIAKDILQAVDFMHKTGYVHADLHPGNIFCSILRDQINPRSLNFIWIFKVGDLGITKREADLNLNYLNTIFADWMRAPECIDQSFGSVDRRVDIYHIGLLLLSLTLGDIPRFTYQEIVDAVPRRMAEGLSSPYRDVIARALRRHVDARTQTAFAVWKEIEEVLERIQIQQG